MTAPTVAVIVVAAGAGTRLGASEPKAFVALAGVTVLERALTAVYAAARAAQVVVVVPKSHLDAARQLARGKAAVVAGAATRQGSVAAGLAVLEPGIRTVLVHDAARALTPAALFERVIDAVEATGNGIVPSLPVADTIKRVGSDATVLDTVDRDELVAVQTPQGFPRESLVSAYEAADAEYTDDAALYSAAGHTVEVVAGEQLAFKITTAWDLRRAEAVLQPSTRTGVGIDVHVYDDSQPLWLGGLFWPNEVGLAGHSDGDALCHAICDALLSATGLGDIGERFGTDDPRFAGAHGNVFIAETLALVTGAGYAVGNVSVQLVAQHPRVGPRRAELESHLTALVGAPVSVSATTSDGLGFTGRGDGIAAIATALVHRA
ncbi:MAG: 2-C-methyl-D-erythritol 2,4-cyclodiphosphate synthase [Salinibacterium sp.]|nr:MAG: 2-C-methyl-D-erythritol 2,4-cyclodiphosphate synthase [Salinibacterium sp.]